MVLEHISLTEIKSLVTVFSEQGTMTEMKNRPTHGLSFCLEGSITYIQNGKEFRSDREHAVLLPMGQDYVIRREKSGRFPLINFMSATEVCDEICVFSVKDVEAYYKDFENMKRLSLSARNRSKLFSIFYDVIHRIELQQASAFSRADGIAAYLEEAYGDPLLTNLSVAERFDISEVYLRKLFLDKFGTTPHQYLLEIRLRRARQQLAEGYLTVGEISELCGFSNVYHFSRTFKHRVGETPTEYMRKNKSTDL